MPGSGRRQSWSFLKDLKVSAVALAGPLYLVEQGFYTENMDGATGNGSPPMKCRSVYKHLLENE
jgi:hypothetical protein